VPPTGEAIASGRSPAPTGETIESFFSLPFLSKEKEEKERLE
jgi:hypothetical protein